MGSLPTVQLGQRQPRFRGPPELRGPTSPNAGHTPRGRLARPWIRPGRVILVPGLDRRSRAAGLTVASGRDYSRANINHGGRLLPTADRRA